MEDGIALFRTSIQANSKDPSLRLNLGLALNMSSRFAEAASALQTVIDAKMSDDFLFYRALARTYGSLKDVKAAQKNEVLYVQKIDATLEEELK
jgi:predicted Zn-dependent protease